MEIIGYLLSIFIGVSLGLIGGGGSILAIPIIVYLFQVEPLLATSYSLFIVGFVAIIGTFQHHKQGNLNVSTALYFGIPSVVSVLLTRKYFIPLLPNNIIEIGDILITKNILTMIVFAILMIAASLSMIKTNKKENIQNHATNKLQLIFYGFIIGVITGFLGAGGGFLIIPVLIFFANLKMKEAVGTSLLIIAINSSIGFVGDIINHVEINWLLLFGITFFASLGMIIGTLLAKKIDGKKLKPAFGWFVLVLGFYIIIKEMFL